MKMLFIILENLHDGKCQQTRNTAENHTKLMLFTVKIYSQQHILFIARGSNRKMEFSFAFHTLSLVAI